MTSATANYYGDLFEKKKKPGMEENDTIIQVEIHGVEYLRIYKEKFYMFQWKGRFMMD